MVPASCCLKTEKGNDMPSKSSGNRPYADKVHAIEGKHFGRCYDQVWGAGRRTLIELLDFPAANSTVMLVKRFAGPVPKTGSDWPDLEALYVYVPVETDNTWDGLERDLLAYAEKRKAARAA